MDARKTLNKEKQPHPCGLRGRVTLSLLKIDLMTCHDGAEILVWSALTLHDG